MTKSRNSKQRAEREPEERILVSMRVEDQVIPAPGSITRPCDDCGRPVWVAPSSRRHLGDRCPVICMACHRKRLSTGEPVQYELAPGAVEEARATVGIIDHLIDQMVADIVRGRPKEQMD
ncbi:MAG: hypothetical protein HYY04_17840 [Chloroflexi bacterium]|nr:hypothetical protein [Chloroflexota bacterium]